MYSQPAYRSFQLYLNRRTEICAHNFKSKTWRITCYLLLFALIFTQTSGLTARATPASQQSGSDAPLAQGDHLVTALILTPDTPNILRTNENVSLTFQYITNDAGGVRIFARPFTDGSPTPGYAAHGSGIYPMGSGQGDGWFTISSGTVVVDQIRIQMLNVIRAYCSSKPTFQCTTCLPMLPML